MSSCEFNFLVIGDWGGSDKAPYYTGDKEPTNQFTSL
jgi:hypothetical protein